MTQLSVSDNDLLEDKAKNGDKEAQHQMGILCALGLAAPLDLEAAKAWFKLSANQGYEPSKVELAKIVNPNFNLLEYFSKSIDKSLQGHERKIGTGSVIIVIDDEDIAFQLVQKTLDVLPVAVLHASNGEKGLKLIANTKPELLALVILDYNLPGLNGLQVLNSIRSMDNGDKINVLMVSGHSEPAHIIQARKNKVLSWIIKPMDKEKIRAIVRKLID